MRYPEGYKLVKSHKKQRGVYRSFVVSRDNSLTQEMIYGDYWTNEPKINHPLTAFAKLADVYNFMPSYIIEKHYGNHLFIVEYEESSMSHLEYPPWGDIFGDVKWPIGTILCRSIRLIKEIT